MDKRSSCTETCACAADQQGQASARIGPGAETPVTDERLDAGGCAQPAEGSASGTPPLSWEEAVLSIPPGRYRHFKGNLYEVIAIARHSETLEPMVVYRALYGDGGVWVRPAAMWNEEITRDGKTMRRFTRAET